MKPLLKEIKKTRPKANNSLQYFTSEQSAFLSSFGREEIREMLSRLKPDLQLHYLARMYNAHDIFADLVRLSGPASVKIISYSITEFPLRIRSQFLEKKIITQLDFLLDFTVSRTPALKQFAQNFANRVKFTDIHSKIVLIENENWHITLISSANFTRNNRFENGIISASEELHRQYCTWFEKLFENASD